MSETTSTISPPAKTTPPFHVGDYVEFRGWRGLLEAGINPFGASGRERLVVTDDCGIEYWHDRATDILFSSPRFSQDSLDHSYQQPTAHIDTRHFVGFDRRAWEQRADRSFIVNRLKVDLASRWLTPGSRILDVGWHVGLFVMLAQEARFDCRGIDISADAIKASRTGRRSEPSAAARPGGSIERSSTWHCPTTCISWPARWRHRRRTVILSSGWQ